MTHETDFLDLYRRLGLQPGCNMDELKQAYRRHVAALHPDRQHGQPVDPRMASRLQRLTAQYGAAMDFHRRHGRLPGAPAASASAGGLQATGDATPVSLGARSHDPFAHRRPSATAQAAPAPPHAGVKTHGKLVVLLVIAALATLGWGLHEASQTASSGTPDEVSESAGAVAQDVGRDAPVLHMGMSAADVRGVEGEPLAMHGDLWEYGPSWVRFDHDEVVEWHSSPLRPLHTGSGAAPTLAR